MVKTEILGVGITNETEEDILEYVLKTLQDRVENYYIVTPNPEIIAYSRKHKPFNTIINQARLALCDGTGVFMASLILGKKIKQRITGVDFMLDLCFRISDLNLQHKKKPITVGFLGAGPKIADRVAECLKIKFPGLRVSFTASELPDFSTSTKNREVSSMEHKAYSKIAPALLNTKYSTPNTDILFVAYGFPKQEEWMAQNINKIPVRVMVGVGGAFDYISGNVTRAPFFVRLFGFEWLYRLIHEPWRIKRQLALLEFAFLVVREKLTGRQ